MRRSRTFFVLAVLWSSACTRETGTGSGDTGAAAAEALEQQGRWAEAAAVHRAAALRLGPERADERVRKAIAAYIMAGGLEAAERFASECLQRSPAHQDVLYYLGEGQRVLQDHEGARATLEKLLAAHPGHARGALSLAHVLLRLGKPAEALPLLDVFLRAADAPARLVTPARIDRARALRRLGRGDEAAGVLAAVLEADPFDPVAIAEAAQVFALLGKGELAKGLRQMHAWLSERGHQLSTEDETKVYSSSPHGSEARLALQAADRREFLRATGELEALLLKDPADTTVRAALARLWLRLHRPGDALRTVEAAPGGALESSDLAAIRAEALAGLGRSEEARRGWVDASARAAAAGDAETERALEIHLRAGRSCIEEGGDPALAEACFRRADLLAPRDWRPRCGLGRAALSRGDAEEAMKSFAAAWQGVNARPGPAELRRWSAVARGLQGELRLAAREIMDLVRSSPGEMENFRAFERIFGAHAGEPEAAQVLAMKKRLEAELEARRSRVLAFSSRPLAQSAAECVDLAKDLLAGQARDSALDLLFLAAELDAGRIETLQLAAGALESPRDVFVRLKTLRRILAAAPEEARALAGAARLYLDLGVRMEEARRLVERLEAVRPGVEAAELRQVLETRTHR